MSSESLKRDRSVHFDDSEQSEPNTKNKVRSLNRTRTNDFGCPVYYQGKIFHFQLSSAFQYTSYVILFFCQYDLQNYSKFIQNGALPIVITHDQPHIHSVYATVGHSTSSLTFTPSFILASDGLDRLISVSFKSVNIDTLDMIRSVIIIDSDLNVVYTHRVRSNRSFPMKSILNCFE
ncbi:hypothetical protein INT48_002428 [Thamnidium elegans]|uniref:Uncharacterized protein n=1 Tax=Thamnidium elegans TaxID=101142 RepID=A0A8H7VXK0_9FUNG|nr:hypothetical protein INT48_002428 [Thamnidium elegans]